MKKPKPKRTNRAQRTQEAQHWAAEDWCFTAQEAYLEGNLHEAEQAARRALRIAPAHPRATLILAEVLHRSSRHREILGIARQAAQGWPNDPRFQFAIADAAFAAGELLEARQAGLRFQELVEGGRGSYGSRRREFLQRNRALLREVDRLLGGDAKPRRPVAAPPTSSPGMARGRAGPGAARPTPAPVATPERAAAGRALDPHDTIERPAARVSRAAVQPSLFDAPPDHPPGPRISRGAASLDRKVRSPEPAAGETREDDTATEVSAGVLAREPTRLTAPQVEVRVEDDGEPLHLRLERLAHQPSSDDVAAHALVLQSQRVLLLSQYEDLLCLPLLRGVDRHEYQIETARKILRRLAGRALLCDEVGLGKTIEAGMVVKEYLLRGLVRSVLILVPPGLVEQWRDEMSQKFDLDFAVLAAAGDLQPSAPPPLAIGSIAFARHGRNFAAFAEHDWDLVVVDEAHHLRRRTTRSWALVNALRKRFVLLLSATPVHNDLMELYELVTLVKPGLLGTPAEFKREFATGGLQRGVRQVARLRELLGEVMVRNTRSHADVVLPRRFASTLLLQPNAAEARTYRAASDYAQIAHAGSGMTERAWLRHLLGCAGSGPRTVADAATRRLGRTSLEAPGLLTGTTDAEPVTSGTDSDATRQLLQEVVSAAGAATGSTKTDRLVEMLAGSDEQMVIFCRFRVTLRELSERLAAEGTPHTVYHGGLSRQEKDAAIERFRNGTQVLLSTESGGEGRNIHFCRTIVNYDLPWDPMLIEQRIGRVHRIGQTRDVFVFNLALAGTLEEELLRILEEKIHLFELVVGEVDSILGHLERREEFADILLDLWAGARDDTDRLQRFDAFGNELAAARFSYEQEKALGDSLLADDLEA